MIDAHPPFPPASAAAGPAPFCRRGLTLVELLVVMLILAALAGAAYQSTTGLVDQSRYEATRRSLEAIEAGVLGPANQYDDAGAPVVTGFVADVGRLPVAVEVEADQPLTLWELWSKPADTAAFDIRTPAGDEEVRLGAGWRGPYVQLSVGGEELLDGWGRRPRLLDADDATPLEAGDPVAVVRSLGADGVYGLADADTYSRDVSVVLAQRTAAPVVSARHLATVYGQVHLRDTDGDSVTPDPDTTIVVRLYGPDPEGDGSLRTLAQYAAVYTASGATMTTTVLDADGDEQTASQSYAAGAEPATLNYQFDAMTIGPRMLRAYVFLNPAQSTPPALEDRLDDLNDSTAPIWTPEDKSVARQVTVRRDAPPYSLNLVVPSS